MDCINSCIEEKIFPNELKMADVIPVFKKEDAQNKINYRPISLLPLLSKIFEKVIQDQLAELILCGFRKGHSTRHAILRLLKYCQNSLDEGKFIGMYGANESFQSLQLHST